MEGDKQVEYMELEGLGLVQLWDGVWSSHHPSDDDDEELEEVEHKVLFTLLFVIVLVFSFFISLLDRIGLFF